MAAVVLDIGDAADARKVQLGSSAAFPHEAVERFAVVHHLLRNELEGDVTGQARVFRLIHHAHATTTEVSANVIVGDCLADHSGPSVPSAAMLGRERSPGQPSVPIHPIHGDVLTLRLMKTRAFPWMFRIRASLDSDTVTSSKLDALGAGYRNPRLFPPRYQPCESNGPGLPVLHDVSLEVRASRLTALKQPLGRMMVGSSFVDTDWPRRRE